MKDTVRLVEVGPRDGLQNESVSLSVTEKVRIIEALLEAGHRAIEVGAFVSPSAVPQMAGSDEVCRALKRREGIRTMALVPNLKGFERALDAGVGEVAVFTATSESFASRNIRASIDESFERFGPVFVAARAAGVPVRGYVSTILHCPYEGPMDPLRCVAVAKRLLDAGCYEVSLGETIGRATPGEVTRLCELIDEEGFLSQCAGHFHDTFGMGVANAFAAFEAGIRTFDASAGGLGGCPYATGAAGNVATEDLIYLFNGLGVSTGVDLDLQIEAATLIEGLLRKPLPGRTYRALVQGTSKP